MKFILFLLFNFSTSLFASGTAGLVPHVVPNAEKLFIRQHTPVWCWAATSSALRNYYHPETPVTQEEIALNNSQVKDGNYIIPYFNPVKQLIPATHDYLIDDVLTTKNYQGYVKYFSVKKAVGLLNKGNPFIMAQNNHVMIIYGYFKIQEHTYFMIYDPNSENFGNNPFMYASQDVLANMFDEAFAHMLFMKPKEEMIAKNISPMWD